MTIQSRALTFNRESLWFDRLPGWSLPQALVVFPSILFCVESLRKPRCKAINFAQEVSFFLDWYGVNEMPRKGKANDEQKRNSKRNTSSPPSWINIQLTDDDAAAIIEQSIPDNELAADLLALSLSGIAVGVKPAPSGDGWMAYLTGIAVDDDTATVGIAGYASTPYDAIAALLYKFHVKLDGQLLKPEPRASRRFG